MEKGRRHRVFSRGLKIGLTIKRGKTKCAPLKPDALPHKNRTAAMVWLP